MKLRTTLSLMLCILLLGKAASFTAQETKPAPSSADAPAPPPAAPHKTEGTPAPPPPHPWNGPLESFLVSVTLKWSTTGKQTNTKTYLIAATTFYELPPVSVRDNVRVSLKEGTSTSVGTDIDVGTLHRNEDTVCFYLRLNDTSLLPTPAESKFTETRQNNLSLSPCVAIGKQVTAYRSNTQDENRLSEVVVGVQRMP